MTALYNIAKFSAAWCLAAVAIYSLVPEECRIGDASRLTTVVLITFVSGLGWLAYHVISSRQGPSIERQGQGDGQFQVTEIHSDELKTEIASSKTIRVFCSGSDTYRSFLLAMNRPLRQGSTIKVLMRADDTDARHDHLTSIALKWQDDIASRDVAVEVRAVAWSPVMIRGWLLDERLAVFGFYHRVGGRTRGQGRSTFSVTDTKMVEELIDVFDATFQQGEPL